MKMAEQKTPRQPKMVTVDGVRYREEDAPETKTETKQANQPKNKGA